MIHRGQISYYLIWFIHTWYELTSLRGTFLWFFYSFIFILFSNAIIIIRGLALKWRSWILILCIIIVLISGFIITLSIASKIETWLCWLFIRPTILPRIIWLLVLILWIINVVFVFIWDLFTRIRQGTHCYSIIIIYGVLFNFHLTYSIYWYHRYLQLVAPVRLHTFFRYWHPISRLHIYFYLKKVFSFIGSRRIK